jgi:hypothetical protein
MVLVDITKPIKKPDMSSLKRDVWIVSPAADVRFMLHLKRDDTFDPAIRKDDVTGDVFPYRLSGAYVVKKAAVVHTNATSSSEG